MIQHVANLVISPLSTYLLHISLHSYQLALHSVSGELEPLTLKRLRNAGGVQACIYVMYVEAATLINKLVIYSHL